MPTLYWNRDTNLVTTTPFDSSPAQILATRGGLDLRVVCQSGDAENGSSVLLANTLLLGIVVRDPANLDGAGYLAGPTVLTRGASAADGYIGTTSTDTTTTRQLTNVGVTDQNQTAEFPAMAALYFVPAGGGDAVESQPFHWTITAKYYQTGAPPATIVESWPSAAQLNAAIALAAGSVHNGDDVSFGTASVSELTFGALSFVFDSSIKGVPQDSAEDPDLVPWSLLVTNGASLPAFLTIPAGQSIRRKADGTGFEAYVLNTGDGSALTNLTPGNLAGPVPIAKGGTGAATAAAALAALGAEGVANKGAANGYAPLDGSSKVPATNLPSYVDDVIEVANLAALPSTGETGKIYLTLDTGFAYRWSGSSFVRIVASPGTTDDLTEGSTKLYFTNARAVAAVGGIIHPVTPGATTGTTVTAASGVTVLTSSVSDNSGIIKIQTSAAFAVGDLLLTINFAASYPSLTTTTTVPHALAVQGADTTSVTGSGTTQQTGYGHVFGTSHQLTSLKIYAGPSTATGYNSGTGAGAVMSGEYIVINYAVFAS